MYTARRELLPLLRIEIQAGQLVHRLREGDLPEVDGGGEWRTSFDVSVSDTLRMLVHASLLRGQQDRDTLTTVNTSVPVLPGRTYHVMVHVGRDRPYGWMVDAVSAAPFRSGTAPFPGDSLFVSWGYRYRGGPIP